MIPVIIINWNGFQDTVECLTSLLRSSNVKFKIHLVDNGSDQEEGARLKEKYREESRVVLHVLQENLGFGKANNYVLEKLLDKNPQYVALLNNDTTVDPHWLNNLVQTAESEGAQMVSSKMLDYWQPDHIDNLGHQMLNTGEIIPIGHGEPADSYRPPLHNLGSCAGATLYDFKMLKKIGFFDPFFTTGYEDAELGLRAVLAGYTSVLAPNALVFHKGGQSIKKIFNAQYAQMIQVSIWYTYFKLMPFMVIFISLPFILLKTFLLSIINILFMRVNYLEIQWRALYLTFFKHWKEIQKKRKDFYSVTAVISPWKVLSRQRFFLWYDLKRFYQIFVKGKKSALDQYGGE